ncbi:ParA family protein [Hyphomicrobium sp. NDB2Meth4]|uniref:ParA family protein n=1 Tax=Hyphomicrobium sp. NDB2Meth4 TaxID=1892846 RepID=UPI0009300644|nr:ParA family protein [Hyphomicrobium sp. NDB2Meth4]
MTVVVAFVSRKGGVGKSTLARALATVAARRGLITTLADLDATHQTSTRWQHLREREGAYPPLAVQRYGNVDSAITREGDCDLLIVDAPSNTPELTGEIASVAHFTVQPAGSSFDDLQPAMELFYELRAGGVPKSRLHIALSRLLDPAEEEAARAYVEVADFSLLPGAVVERARYREAHNQGLAFIECAGEPLNGSAGILLSALLTKIMQKHRLLHEDKLATAPPDLATAQFAQRPVRGLSSYSKAAS